MEKSKKKYNKDVLKTIAYLSPGDRVQIVFKDGNRELERYATITDIDFDNDTLSFETKDSEYEGNFSEIVEIDKIREKSSSNNSNPTCFIISYLFLMLPTYIWRYTFFTILLKKDILADFTTDDLKILMFVCISINYLFLIYIAGSRGEKSGYRYLWCLPLIGGFFDVLIGFVPFVPTIMNIATLLIGTQSRKEY